jgi:hypothetical protein
VTVSAEGDNEINNSLKLGLYLSVNTPVLIKTVIWVMMLGKNSLGVLKAKQNPTNREYGRNITSFNVELCHTHSYNRFLKGLKEIWKGIL